MVIAVILLSSCSTISRFPGKNLNGEKNIINNPSFEIASLGSDSFPASWTSLDGQEDNIYTVDKSRDNIGKCLKIEKCNGYARLISDSFEIDAQAVYFTRCYVKSTNYNREPVILHFFAFDADGNKVNDFKTEIIIKENWTPIELTTGFFANSASVARLGISIPECSQNTAYWVDDVGSYNIHKFAYRYQVD